MSEISRGWYYHEKDGIIITRCYSRTDFPENKLEVYKEIINLQDKIDEEISIFHMHERIQDMGEEMKPYVSKRVYDMLREKFPVLGPYEIPGANRSSELAYLNRKIKPNIQKIISLFIEHTGREDSDLKLLVQRSSEYLGSNRSEETYSGLYYVSMPVGLVRLTTSAGEELLKELETHKERLETIATGGLDYFHPVIETYWLRPKDNSSENDD